MRGTSGSAHTAKWSPSHSFCSRVRLISLTRSSQAAMKDRVGGGLGPRHLRRRPVGGQGLHPQVGLVACVLDGGRAGVDGVGHVQVRQPVAVGVAVEDEAGVLLRFGEEAAHESAVPRGLPVGIEQQYVVGVLLHRHVVRVGHAGDVLYPPHIVGEVLPLRVGLLEPRPLLQQLPQQVGPEVEVEPGVVVLDVDGGVEEAVALPDAEPFLPRAV